MSPWDMVGKAISRLLSMALVIWVANLFGAGWTWSWRWALAMVIGFGAWDYIRASRRTDRRHYSVSENDLEPGLRAVDPVRVQLIDFEPNVFVRGGIPRVLAETNLPVSPAVFTLAVHHDRVNLHTGGEVILTAPNPEWRVGRRHSVGVMFKQVMP